MRQANETRGFRSTAGLAMVLGVLLLAVGCERPQEKNGGSETTAPEEESVESEAGRDTKTPAGRAAEAFLKSVQYRDVEGALERHIESTRQGIYCRSESFGKVLERTRREKTDKDCEDARAMDSSALASLEEDAALLVQILRFACEEPEGDCVDYARRVFASQMPETSFWEGMGDFDIKQVKVDSGTARVYVDYWRGKKSEETVNRRAIKLERVEGDWLVSTAFGESSAR